MKTEQNFCRVWCAPRVPTGLHKLLPLALVSLLAGCASLTPPPPPPAIACTMRFKMVTRPEDQARVEQAVRLAAVGPVAKSGTPAYPEYRFHVARLADIDTLLPRVMHEERGGWLRSERRQALNLHSAGVAFTFDSTDVSASAATKLTFNVKPGSRLYYKNPGGSEVDITAQTDKNGRVTLPVEIQDGQRFIHARAIKDNVVRYIRVNVFTGATQDISQREY